MRTKAQAVAAYRWLKPSVVADELNCAEDLVRDHIRAGHFADVNGEPGVIDIGSGGTPQYRINPESFRAFRKARQVRSA